MRNLLTLLQNFSKRNKGTYFSVIFALTFGALFVISAAPEPAKADDLPVVHVSGTLSESTTWTSDNIYVVDSKLTVPNGLTLTISAGTIVKYAYGWGDTAIQVNAGGTLNATGTPANSIMLTSLKDDSTGGDTGGDGATTPTTGDYTAALMMNGGTVNIAHANFAYGTRGVGEPSYPGSGSELAITDSSFEHLYWGVDLMSENEEVMLERNNFVLANPGNNYFALSLNDVADLSDIVLAGADKNTFVGSGPNTGVRISNSTVPLGSTWTIDSSSGAILWGVGDAWYGGTNTIAGVLTLNSGVKMVAEGDSGATAFKVNGSLNMYNNTTVKTANSAFAIQVNSGGVLNVVGTSANPVTFTSLKDDSVGGDTGSDGTTTPAAGNYAAALQLNGGDVDVLYATFKYATRAIGQPPSPSGGSSLVASRSSFSYLHQVAGIVSDTEADFDDAAVSHVSDGIYVDDSAKVAFRGSFSDVAGKAITACKWGSLGACSVDAAYTEWGSADGPFATDPDDNLVCGAVTVAPWKHGSNTYDNDSLFNVKNCDNSSTPEDNLTLAVSGYQSDLTAYQIDCNNGLQDACDQINTMFSCVNAAVGLALYNSPFPAPGSSATEAAATFSGDVVSASTTYIQGVETGSVASRASVISGVGQILGIFSGLTNAYNSCR